MGAGRGTKKVRLRARVWMESPKGGAILTEAGADLLEQIDVCGSLSEAARRLGFAYRRAWLLLDAMNSGWEEPVVKTAAGGKHGGGARVTEYGKMLLAAYRDLQVQVEHAVDEGRAGFLAATGMRE